jgi:hypothetical protein
MNRFNSRAWTVLASGLGLATVATAQEISPVPGDQDYEVICDNLSTTQSNFSNYNALRQRTDLFAFTVGTNGTVNFEQCFAPNSPQGGFVANVGGRIGFAIGRTGSIQDIAVEGQPIDDDLQLQMGMPYGVGGNWGYAVIVRESDNGARTYNPWGSGDNVDSYFTGASDRYCLFRDTVDNALVTLRADLLGDAARLSWTLENRTENASRLGLWFGQWVVGAGPTGAQLGMHYVRVPGRRPLVVDTRFVRNPQSGVFPIENPMPSVLEFGLSQSWHYGLQVILQPTTGASSALSDQTPCDGVDVGDAGVFRTPSLLGSQLPGNNGRPMSAGYSTLFEDVFFIAPNGSDLPDGSGYIQKWDPASVGGVADSTRFRNIVAYYKSTTGNSDYARPYSAVVDAPRTVGVLDSNPNQFNPGTSTIRVYVDNARGFTTVNQAIAMNDVRIKLTLPQGMTDATDPTNQRFVIEKRIDTVPPNDSTRVDPFINPIPYVDFQVRIDPSVFGAKSYSVEIRPQPGATKTIQGVINVASQPRLQLRPSANLVTAPWQFVNGTWAAILGSGTDPLTPDVDYQVFQWDAERQAYTVQAGPQRGKGSFIISRRSIESKQLGGTPRTPSDFAKGAPPITLKPGWNLIANPYNYPIEIGQIVGVNDADDRGTLTYEELVQLNYVSGSLAWWDTDQQAYQFTEGFAEELLPNRGYWIFVPTTDDISLNFPPVFTPFIPRGSGGIENTGGWKLNLVAASAKGSDSNYVGTAATQAQVNKLRVMEPPVAPLKGAISASLIDGNARLARSFRTKSNRVEWNYEVTPTDGGTVKITWPNISQVPSNVKLTAIDSTTGTKYDLRKQSSVAFFGKAGKSQSYRIVAEDAASVALLGSASASATTMAATVRYQVNDSASTTVRILQNGKLLANLLVNKSDVPGNKSVNWNLKDSTGRRVRAGVYVAEVRVTSSGKTETKSVSFLVR